MIPEELVELVPKEFAERHKVFPIDKLGKMLTIAMACPLDEKTIHELEEITGLRVKAFVCGWEDIDERIRKYY